MVKASNFIYETASFEKINQCMVSLKKLEIEFKNHLKYLLEEEVFQSELTSEIKESFRKYTSRDWKYFNKPEYDNAALEIMFASMNGFQFVVSKTFLKVKKDLLEYLEELERK